MTKQQYTKTWDKDGKSIQWDEWLRKAADDRYRNVRQTSIVDTTNLKEARHVSTSWFGIDMSIVPIGNTPIPLIFETRVWDPLVNTIIGNPRKYSTLESAQAGHREVVSQVVDQMCEPLVVDIDMDQPNTRRGPERP